MNVDELVYRARKGDKDALSSIITTYSDLVSYSLRDLFLDGGEREDLIQEGMIGLMKAVNRYDCNRFASFRTFASICIRRQVLGLVKRSTASKRNYSLLKLIGSSFNFDSIGLKDRLEPEKIYRSEEIMRDFYKFLDVRLSSLEKKIFDFMLEGYSYKDIAIKINCKFKSVDNAVQRIRKKCALWCKVYDVSS